MSDCLFCKIAEGEVPSDKVYEDDNVYAFRDINPQATVHVLVIPKKHVASLDYWDAALEPVISAIPKIAEAERLISGYRVISNIGSDAHQSVKHLHFHILGGQDLGESLV